MTFRAGAALTGLVLAAVPALAGTPSGKPHIEPLDVRRDGGRLLVSFTIRDALSEDALDRIRSGLALTQRHRVELLSRRAVPLWPAQEHGRMRIDTSAVYDSLTRKFELTRTIRTRPGRRAEESVSEQHATTDSIDEVRRWMTEFDALPSLDIPEMEHEERLKVRVRSTLGRHFVLYLFPARQTVSAERKLEP